MGVIASLPSPEKADEEDVHVGWVQSIDANCQAKWKAHDKADEKTLNPTRDRYRFLYQGEILWCAGRGSMKAQIYNLPPQEIKSSDGRCTIGAEALICEHKPQKREAAEKKTIRIVDQRALEAFGRPAGRRRGFRTVIYSPAEDSVVRTEKIVFRWNTPRKTTAVELRLTDIYGDLLWKQEQVQGAAGQFVSEEARRILKAYGDDRKPGPLSVTLRGDGIDPSAVHFSLLSAADEAALEKDLRTCDQESDLRRAVCRTYSFTQRQMWNEAAEEHDAALQLEPQSKSLILAAIAAHRSTGNAKRVAELMEELPAGTQVPD